MTVIHDLSAVELATAYRDRSLSPVEVTQALLARIQEHDPLLNAMYLVHGEAALASARAAETRIMAGKPLSALDGVPITLKDNIATAGTPTPLGTAATDLKQITKFDSPPAARVREAGCVILGKTTMPDFGMLASGVSSLHGITRNPWDTSRNTAGSSSGAGAAIAAGFGPLALGTDIGGSVRLPASFCGIFAHKPSQGRVPVDPPYLGRVTGPMTRTVADAALLMELLSKPDPRDWMSLPFQEIGYASRLKRKLKGVKLGLILDIGAGMPVEPEVKAAITAAAKTLERAGAIVTNLRPPLNRDLLTGLDRFFRARSLTDMLRLPPERLSLAMPFIRDWANAATSWSAVELMRAMNDVFTIRQKMVAVTQPFDFLLTPTLPIAAYEAEAPCPGGDPERPFEHIAFTAPFNQSEQPACSINAGYTKAGLPIGLQIVGHRFDDLGVLQLASAFEQLRGPQKPWPIA